MRRSYTITTKNAGPSCGLSLPEPEKPCPRLASRNWPGRRVGVSTKKTTTATGTRSQRGLWRQSPRPGSKILLCRFHAKFGRNVSVRPKRDVVIGNIGNYRSTCCFVIFCFNTPRVSKLFLRRFSISTEFYKQSKLSIPFICYSIA